MAANDRLDLEGTTVTFTQLDGDGNEMPNKMFSLCPSSITVNEGSFNTVSYTTLCDIEPQEKAGKQEKGELTLDLSTYNPLGRDGWIETVARNTDFNMTVEFADVGKVIFYNVTFTSKPNLTFSSDDTMAKGTLTLKWGNRRTFVKTNTGQQPTQSLEELDNGIREFPELDKKEDKKETKKS